MNYEFYKVLHYSSILVFFSSLGIAFFADQKSKLNKIVNGISGLLILVAGMGLILKGLGISHGESWPAWLHAKIFIWAVLVIAAPIMAKRMIKNRVLAFYVLLSLGIVAIFIAVTKPF